MKLICGLLALCLALLIGCEKKSPEPTEFTLTPGMKAASKAYDKGQYAEAAKLYTAELAAEETKPAPSWVQLSALQRHLGLALDDAGQYDRALEYHQKSLAIFLKQMGADHPNVATIYDNMAFVCKAKKDLPKAKEYWEKAHAIFLKRLGPNHPDTKNTKAKLDALKE